MANGKPTTNEDAFPIENGDFPMLVFGEVSSKLHCGGVQLTGSAIGDVSSVQTHMTFHSTESPRTEPNRRTRTDTNRTDQEP